MATHRMVMAVIGTVALLGLTVMRAAASLIVSVCPRETDADPAST